MDHRYMYKIAELYNNEDLQSEEIKQKIEKLETEAVARYITDISNAVGIRRGMDDLPIVIAALRAQSDFLLKTMDDDRKKYVEHLVELMANMKVCSIEIDVAELIKQIHSNDQEKQPDIKTDENTSEPEQDGK